jgi:hypothetical protein
MEHRRSSKLHQLPCYVYGKRGLQHSHRWCVLSLHLPSVLEHMTDCDAIVLVLVIPIYKVWKLQMPLRRKIAVIIIFALGSFVLVTGVIRLKLLIGVYGALEDPTWRDLTCK